MGAIITERVPESQVHNYVIHIIIYTMCMGHSREGLLYKSCDLFLGQGQMYIIVISRLGEMYPVYSHEHEGAKRPSASDYKPDTSRLGVI